MLLRFAGGVGGQASVVVPAAVAVSGPMSRGGLELVFAVAASVALAASVLAYLIEGVGRAPDG